MGEDEVGEEEVARDRNGQRPKWLEAEIIRVQNGRGRSDQRPK